MPLFLHLHVQTFSVFLTVGPPINIETGQR